jgi:hypothetical protein
MSQNLRLCQELHARDESLVKVQRLSIKKVLLWAVREVKTAYKRAGIFTNCYIFSLYYFLHCECCIESNEI